jgi:hypothetical protein
MKKKLAILGLLAVSAAKADDDITRCSNWNVLPENYRSGYISGLYEGMFLWATVTESKGGTSAVGAVFPMKLRFGTIVTEVTYRCSLKENSNKPIYSILAAIKEDENK